MTETTARRLKYVFLALACMLLILAGIAMLRFDPAGFARQLVRLAQESGQRTLRLEGDARLTLFPGLGVELSKCMLSGRGNGKTFATLASLRLELAWMPLLLRGETVVKSIRVNGLRADLLRDREGATNFGDLLDGDGARWPRFELHKINIEHTEIRFRDESAGHAYALRVDSGQVLFGPGGIDLDARGSGLGLSELAVSMQFARPAEKHANTLALALNGKRGADNFDLRLVAANLRGAPEKFSAEKISLVAQLGHGDDSLDAVLDLPAVAGGFDAAHAGAAMLEINRAWKSGALSSKHSGAADLKLAKGWLEWPAAQTEVRLRDRNKPEVVRVWHGATRFDAAAALPGS